MFTLVITGKHVLYSFHLSPSAQLRSDALQFITLGDIHYEMTTSSNNNGVKHLKCVRKFPNITSFNFHNYPMK